MTHTSLSRFQQTFPETHRPSAWLDPYRQNERRELQRDEDTGNWKLSRRSPMSHGFKSVSERGPRMAQSVKCPTLDYGSGHDLMVHGFEPHVGLCTGSVELAWDSHTSLLSASPTCALSLSLSK